MPKQRQKRRKSKRRRILPKTRPMGMTEAQAIAQIQREKRIEADVEYLLKTFTPRQIDAIYNREGWSDFWRRGLFYPQAIPEMVD